VVCSTFARLVRETLHRALGEARFPRLAGRRWDLWGGRERGAVLEMNVWGAGREKRGGEGSAEREGGEHGKEY
jgi:hypothetical protein